MEARAILLFLRFPYLTQLYRSSDGEYFTELDECEAYISFFLHSGSYTIVERITPLPEIPTPIDENAPIWVYLSNPASPLGLGYDAVVSDTEDTISQMGEVTLEVNNVGAFKPSNWVHAVSQSGDTIGQYKLGRIVSIDTGTITILFTNYQGVPGLTSSDWAITLVGSKGDNGLIWKNTWNNAVTYNLDDAVFYQGSSYRSKVDNNLNHAVSNNTYWQLLASKGDNGLVWKGEWSNATTYAMHEAVTKFGSSYRSKVDNNLNHAVTSSDHWELLAAKGLNGIAAKGVWSNAVTYAENESVTSGGSFYRSKVDGNINHVVTDTDYWELIAAKGDTGTQWEVSNATGNIQKVDGAGKIASKLKKVDTIAQLKTIEGVADESCLVNGYYAKGDGGGSEFYWDAVSTATDNGGTIIQVTGVTAGRWLRIYNKDILIEYFGAKGDSTTNDSVAVQKAIDFVESNGGGTILFSSGKIYSMNIKLKTGVNLLCDRNQYGLLSSSISGCRINPFSSGWIIDTDAPTVYSCSIKGFDFAGLGSGTSSGGIRLQSGKYVTIEKCSFNNFTDQALLILAGNACVIEDILATNCLMDRTKSFRTGVIEIGGADHFLNRIEATCSLSALYSSNLYLVAILIKATNSFISACIGELSEVGIVNSAGAMNRYVNCRADLNFGHGFMITSGGANIFSNCHSVNNSKEGTSLYSGFYLSSTQMHNLIVNCYSLNSLGYTCKYGIEDNTVGSTTTQRTQIVNFGGNGVSTNLIYSVFNGAAINIANYSIDDNTSGSHVLSVLNITVVRFTQTAAATITNFTNPVQNQVIRIIGNVNVTIQNGTNIYNTSAADLVLQANKAYSYIYVNTKWYQLTA